jgi:carbonic anhydrase
MLLVESANERIPAAHFIPLHTRVCVSIINELLANNARYTKTFNGPLPLPPAKHVAVVACMDARLDVYIRSLAISQRLLATLEIILIHHTDRGMLTFTDNQFKKSIQDDTGIKPAWSAEAFPDLDEDVRQSIARIKASPFVPNKKSIRGFVFVATDKLHEVQDHHHRDAVVKTSFLDRLVRRLGA